MSPDQVVLLRVVGVCFIRGLSTEVGGRDAPNLKEVERVVTFASAYVIPPHLQQSSN